MIDGVTATASEDAPATESDGAGLRVLFDVGHPAQVHLFRNAIEQLRADGHETFVTSREKEVTTDLLDAYGIDHRSLSTRGDSLPSLVAELLVREWRLLAVAREFDPDVIVSRLGPVPAHVSAALGCRNVVVSDTHVDESLLQRVYQGITFPFVDTTCAPADFELPVDDADRRPLDFQELAYLHPRYFEPDPERIAPYGLYPDHPYFVVRVAGWDAYHDVGYDGLSPSVLRELIGVLEQHGTVLVSAEKALPADLESYRLQIDPSDIHQVLYHADLYVGDSGTMSTEAAMLGTPAIRTNTMVGDEDENVFRELESRYGLLESFADADRAVEAVRRHVESDVDRAEYRRRREQLIADHPDVTDRLVETILETTDE
ncbi:DUF354 domain-containing protein [Halapricum sp. CBA1109]|uniref:DUF354 domain-containing protein n=1 Tax=Halapricum sp. CBA1109 TaxID=2668068 RepID=UPI0012F9A042|nr:DUF354 domain-containing protein [Halapricum sp. CBA1109]MUV88806.1 DUF354 domain-containing protein [Halapricum sp. CBA1109]